MKEFTVPQCSSLTLGSIMSIPELRVVSNSQEKQNPNGRSMETSFSIEINISLCVGQLSSALKASATAVKQPLKKGEANQGLWLLLPCPINKLQS